MITFLYFKSGRLTAYVRSLLDEFTNIGLIPKFEKLIIR